MHKASRPSHVKSGYRRAETFREAAFGWGTFRHSKPALQTNDALMSALGQNAKYSERADVFCFASNNGHRSTPPPCRKSATCGLLRRTRAYSITSSASICIETGTSIPSALAVFKLMTSSNFVGCRTGRSAGFLPIRIWPVRAPPCRYRSSEVAP